ncbi:MAG TPA: hypothetical protein VMJ10_27680 [Kofleriaceae bacterium]|nr:hypothetical protein [Kofleriaceae bacterium]
MLRLSIAPLLLLFACGTDNGVNWNDPQVLHFGPYSLDAEEEITTDCVQITLNNDTDLYINSVEFNSGPGFHHSNWFWVPESSFPGPHWNGKNSSADDGTFTCTDRNFDQSVAALFGGVVFAQSTQAQHEDQQFPTGYAIKIAAHSKLVANIHLLNPGDNAITIKPTLTLTPIPESSLIKQLAGLSFEDHALGLPPNMQSSFAVDTCDLIGADQNPPAPWPTPTFKIYYALAHYHALGTGETIEAIKSDGTATPFYTTTSMIGDSLGAPIDPPFDFTGYTGLRFSCDYYNNTASTVVWGTGTNEMCVFLAFTDSDYNFGGGVPVETDPGPGTMNGNVMSFTHKCDTVIGNPLN